MQIQNHQTQLDVIQVIYLIDPFPSFLGKREALSIPMFKYVIKPLDFILVGRDKKDSKEHREQLIIDLAER